MFIRSRLVSLALVLVFAAAATGCSESPKRQERWATTENTAIEIDWNAVNEAYKQADGPTDLERRINEIYKGDEIISIAVQDRDAKTQVITGFFDRNGDGAVGDAEKIFTIQRDVTGEGAAQYQTHGYGPYLGYHSPVFSIMSGMLMGSMMSSMFMPGYRPIYTQPYTTSPARHAEIRNQRSGYRAQNPQRFEKPSQTGRTYGGTRSSGGSPGKSRGGGRFGLHREGRDRRPVRLSS